MKIQVIILLALSLCVTSRNNDDDEGRPYEFGFTIDGQQHRHESKDVNGIVMGEFGFITADGIYHVTVYATDENGSFKILSMRNVRVSGPLDEPGYEFPSKTSGGQQPQPQNNPAPPPPTTTLAPTTNNAPYKFTTPPSLDAPSCSSCKLPKPRPAGASNKFPFQTPEFQDKKPISSIPPGTPPSSPFGPPPAVPQIPQLPISNIPAGTPPSSPFGNPPAGLQIPQFNNPPLQGLPHNPPVQSVFTNSKAGPENLDNYGVEKLVPRFEDKPSIPVKPSIEQQPPFQNPVSKYPSNDILLNPSPFGPTHENLQNPPNPGVQTPTNQYQKPTNPNSKPPHVTVSNHQINIPGKDPIPIKDSYPNMVDGLPNGITENDMLDLLYKFNYTLGFHGHHERGLKNGAKIGAYFVNGRDGIMRVVEYIADENGYRPKVKFINLGLDSPDTPKEGSEKTFGLKGFEFVWYPI